MRLLITTLIAFSLIAPQSNAQCDIDPSMLSITQTNVSNQILCFVGCAVGYELSGVPSDAVVTWDFGNGAIGTGNDAYLESFTCYNEPSLYIVVATVVCPNGNTYSLTHLADVTCGWVSTCAPPTQNSIQLNLTSTSTENCVGCVSVCPSIDFFALPADYPLDLAATCVDYEFSDGTVIEGSPYSDCVTACFEGLSSGSVCATFYCCNAPSESVTACLDFTLPCEQLDVPGCAYEAAINYNPAATIDDGSCEFFCPNDCTGDVNGDNSVSIADILILLSQFGIVCD